MIKKFAKIVLINIFLFLFLIFISDVVIYCYYSYIYYKLHNEAFKRPKFSYILKPYYGINFETYFDGSDNVFRGRKPEGIEYSDKPPIVVFGCSYAHGQFLNNNQTFGYLLAHILKRPVYNRAFPGRGIGLMYWQSTDDGFYKTVPPCDSAIYIFIPDHYRRLLINFIDVLDLHLTGHFNKKGNNLYLDGDNYLKNLMISSYSYKVLNNKYVNWYINNPKHEEELTDTVLLYFIKTRENLQKHWKHPVDFTIVYYNNAMLLYKDTLFKKLKENNFKIIETDELTNVDLNSPEFYSVETSHPTAKAWEILTPLIAKEFQKQSN